MPEISGTVVSEETGEPVTYAEIFVRWGVSKPLPALTGGGIQREVLESRWVTTDEAGRFRFPALTHVIPARLRERGEIQGPVLDIVHWDYFGMVGAEAWAAVDGIYRFDADNIGLLAVPRSLVIRAKRTSPRLAEAMRDKGNWEALCSFFDPEIAEARCCEVIYQDPDFCCKAVHGSLDERGECEIRKYR